ncbi:MAG: hypothetical protein J7M27_04260 [Candidatus Latescibacteria bacterium]|nr:hypothetical protein [Candidatus Latescibacterota bacterium]
MTRRWIRVLSALGFSVKRRSFKRRFDILRDIDVVAPRIIRKVRDARNLLEHDYVCPERKEVEDALDIATLFVLAIDRVFLLFPLRTYVYNEDEPDYIKFVPSDCLLIEFKEEEVSPLFNVDIRRDSETVGSITVDASDQYFVPIIRLFIAIQRDGDIEGAKGTIASMIG